MHGAAEGHLWNCIRKSEWKGSLGTFRDKHEEIMWSMILKGSKCDYVHMVMKGKRVKKGAML
jgi:hypothetical protein